MLYAINLFLLYIKQWFQTFYSMIKHFLDSPINVWQSCESCQACRLLQRRHSRVLGWWQRRVLLHRGQRSTPGRAHRYRRNHRVRLYYSFIIYIFLFVYKSVAVFGTETSIVPFRIFYIFTVVDILAATRPLSYLAIIHAHRNHIQTYRLLLIHSHCKVNCSDLNHPISSP